MPHQDMFSLRLVQHICIFCVRNHKVYLVDNGINTTEISNFWGCGIERIIE